jgi:hypothetical protein
MDLTATTMPIGGSMEPRERGSVSLPPLPSLQRQQLDFTSVMARAQKGEQMDDERAAREAASDFVAAAFIEPLLKQMRESNDAAPPFAPGPAEKQFRGLMDAQLARQVSRGAHFPLVDAVAQKLLGLKPAAPPTYSPLSGGGFPPVLPVDSPDVRGSER